MWASACIKETKRACVCVCVCASVQVRVSGCTVNASEKGKGQRHPQSALVGFICRTAAHAPNAPRLHPVAGSAGACATLRRFNLTGT